MNRLLVIVVCSLSFLSVNIFAQEEEAKQIQLTSSDLKTFVQSFPQIVEEFKKLDIKYDAENYEFNVSEASEIVNEVNAVVRKHGYKDYSDFYIKAGTISMTYAAIKMEKEGVDVQPEIEQAIKEIENNQHYSAEQKKQMIDMLKQNSQMLDTMSKDMADEKNITVVRPYVDQIETALDIE